MALAVNDMVLERFRLTERLPAPLDMERWAVTDTTNDALVELWLPTKLASMRNGADAAALAAQFPATHPAVLKEIARGTVSGRHAVIYPTTNGPLSCPTLSPEQVPVLAGWLAGAIEASGWTGTLCSGDLALDANQIVRLSVRPVAPSHSLARIPHETAPEVLDGAAGGAAAPLYGLGVWLFRGLTGANPVEARTRTQLRQGQQAPRSIQSIRPELPDEVAQIIDRLLDPNPEHRLGTTRDLGEPAPIEIASSQDKPTKEAVPTKSTTAEHRPLPVGNQRAIVDPTDLTDKQRARLAALTGILPSTLEEMAEQGTPITVAAGKEVHRVKASAALAERIGLPVDMIQMPSAALSLLGAAATGLPGIGAVVGGLGAMAIGQLGLGVGVLAAGVSLTIMSLMCLRLGLKRSQQRRRIRAANRARPDTQEPLALVLSTHQAVLLADLAAPIQFDLEHQLDILTDAFNQGEVTTEEMRLTLTEIREASEAYTVRDEPIATDVTKSAKAAAQAAKKTFRELN